MGAMERGEIGVVEGWARRRNDRKGRRLAEPWRMRVSGWSCARNGMPEVSS